MMAYGLSAITKLGASNPTPNHTPLGPDSVIVAFDSSSSSSRVTEVEAASEETVPDTTLVWGWIWRPCFPL